MKKVGKLPAVITLRTAAGEIPQVKVAQSAWSRGMGLLREKPPGLPPERALLITNANSIHGMWMRVPIEVIFLDHNWRVVRVHTPCRPWQYLFYCRKASMALEAAIGTAERLQLKPGQAMELGRPN